MTGPEIQDFDNDGVVFTDAEGNEIAAKRAKMVSRDVNGNVKFSQEGTDSITGVTATGVTNTASVTGASGRVNFDRVQASINTGTADLSLLRDGSVLTSVTGVTSGDFVESAGTPNKSSPDWSLNVNFGNLPQTQGVVGEDTTSVQGVYDQPFLTATVTGVSGSKVTGTAVLHDGGTGENDSIDLYFTLSKDGTSLTGALGGVSQYSETTTKVLSSTTSITPQNTITAQASMPYGFVGVSTAMTATVYLDVLGQQDAPATANLTASRNQVTTVS